MTLDHAWKAKALHLHREVVEWERSYELLENVKVAQEEELARMRAALNAISDKMEHALAELRLLYRVPDYLQENGDDADPPAHNGDREAEGDTP